MGGYGPFTWHVLFTSWQPNLVWDPARPRVGAYIGALGPAAARAARAALVPGAVVRPRAADPRGRLNTAIETYGHVLFWVPHGAAPAADHGGAGVPGHGQPVDPARPDDQRRTQERIQTWLTVGVVAFLTHPIVGFLLYAAIIIGTHLTSFMQQMMLHPWLHQTEHVLYLGGGYIFLLPLLGNEPIRWRPPFLVRLLALFIAMAPETVVGIVLLQADHVLFPAYAEVHRMWGPTPLRGPHRGGGIMWAFGDGLMMLFIVGVILVYIAHSATNATAGGWLEGVRRRTLADRLASAGESASSRAATSTATRRRWRPTTGCSSG